MLKSTKRTIPESLIKTVSLRLAGNKKVRRSLPVWGRVHIDRQLPFLCIYRRLKDQDVSQTERLITGEASYLIATGIREQHTRLSQLVKSIARTLKEKFGSFLIVEVWTKEAGDNADAHLSTIPIFKIIRPRKSEIFSTVDTLENALKEIRIRTESAQVEVIASGKISPPGLRPLITIAEANQLGYHILGIEIRPIYHNAGTGQVFPLVRQNLKRGLARALKNSFFKFTHDHTPYRPLHYLSLGRWSMVKAVWEVDRQLAEICNGFDFILQVTPTNDQAAWSAFLRSHFEKLPKFEYRPIPLDPALSKRRLFRVPIERIEDPTMAQLFREQQLELDRKFTMLIDRDTVNFMYGSLQLYGSVEDGLMKRAIELLEQLPARSRDGSQGSYITAKIFAARAMQELAFFRRALSQTHNKVFVREDITGLMVSQGVLLVGARIKIPETRVEALIQHEVGTHVLTYLNGKAQPFRQLYIGLAGYEELQEGLAVLSEYLVDGLTCSRLRLLAARVVAARHMTDGASFIEVFRELNKTHGFERRTAFNISMRTFRCGGLTKDAVYLRGLIRLLEYLKSGGMLEPLFVGKISLNHIGIINELHWRKVLHPAPLRPSYLDKPETAEKLNNLRGEGLSPINLITRSK